MGRTKAELLEGTWDVVSSKKIGNNTLEVRYADGTRAIRLHNTDVVTFEVNGDVRLDTGGWRTVTTKDRISAHMPGGWWLYTDRGVWYVSDGSPYGKGSEDRAEWVFADNMVLHANGTVSGAGVAINVDRLTRRIRAYVKGYIAALDGGEVPAPGAEDCSYCLMREVETNQPLGEHTRDTDHLESHMTEKYYVPSLLARATEVLPVSNVAKWYLSDKWAGSTNNFAHDFARRELGKVLYRYLKRQLGLQA